MSLIEDLRSVRCLTLFMPGKALTRKEPLIGRTGSYPHPETTRGLKLWGEVWLADGKRYVEGPVIVEVYVRVNRPPSHLNKGGEINAAGRRHTVPPRFDLSNVIKLVEDGLKGLAMGDDSLVAGLHAMKQWATITRPAGVEVTISRFGARSED